VTAIQTRLPAAGCPHSRHVDVETEGGDVIARRCAGCAAIACHVAVCDGCGEKGDLYLLRGPGKRYHGEKCEKAHKDRIAAARAAKRAAEREKERQAEAKRPRQAPAPSVPYVSPWAPRVSGTVRR